ncbi:MAG: polymer-forming cytoskeletal protein [Proteobacteria bacterium]|uniref:bactofilin family protein n=1 Tax=Ottowia sp. TaxID=1898956 RepID=UPI001DF74967|nr:polymer-forming cytoskeletal protein [Ottowia sp.]MBS0401549.1 polymer-forming cytoskeletal protein [Pseudomonadota bacterium]
MLGINKKQAPPAIRSAIGVGMQVSGRCSFQDGLQIEGTVLGDVTGDEGAPSMLLVHEGGRVEGAISADHIVVAGLVVGPVLARERLELLASGRIEGDVRYKTLEMQPGAVVAGQLQPQVTPPPPVRELPAPVEPAAPEAAPIEPTFELRPDKTE